MLYSRSPWSPRQRRATHISLEKVGVLDVYQRWYGAVLSVVLAGVLVISGITPASANVVAPPADSSQPADPAAEDGAATPPAEEAARIAAPDPVPAESETPTPEPSTTAPESKGVVAPAPVVPEPIVEEPIVETPVIETPAPAEPVVETPAPAEPVVETPAPVVPVTETVAPVAPVIESPAPPVTETTPPVQQTKTPVPTKDPKETGKSTPTPTPTPTPTLESKLAGPGMSLLAALTDCGTGTSCGRLDVSINVVGGTATAANWILTATDTTSADVYTLVSGNEIGVKRPATYTLAATAVDAALAAGYTASLTCDADDRVTYSAANSTLAYSASSNTRNRTAECIFTFIAPTSANVTAYVGGDRTGLSGLVPLQNATLRLWAGDSSGPTAAFATPWSVCTSNASGACTFTVPDTNINMVGGQTATTGGNKDRQFWIVQESAPAGWVINTHIATGGSGGTSTAYTARTNAMNGTNAQDSRIHFMIGTGDTTARASGGTFAMSRNNFGLQEACGVNVALVVDLSGSLSGQLPAVKDASKAMVTALEGTNSTVGIYTFANTAPATSGGNYAETAVSTATGANALRSHIDTFTTPNGATNWDRGLSQVPTGTYDAVIVITDGNPTVYGNNEGPGDYTRFREVENGVFSANELKTTGTRVIAVGVGAGVSGLSNNLRAISGPTLGSDYFQAANFDNVKQVVRDFALGDCLGSLTVVKQMVPAANQGENVTGATPASGWTFDASSLTSGLGLATSSQVTQPVTGAANFGLTYSNGLSTGTVRVNEVAQSGFGIVTQGSFNAVCKATTIGGAVSNVAVTNQTIGVNPGFDVAVPANASVSCVVYNKPAIVKTGITVDKVWDVNGTLYTNLTNPLAEEGLTASLTLAGTAQAWGTSRGGLGENTSVSIAESVSVMPAALPQCVATGSVLRTAGGVFVSDTLPFPVTLDADEANNAYTITNTIDCAAKLTLNKFVSNGPAVATDWTLTAHAQEGGVTGPTGTSGVSGIITPGARYALGEAGPATYIQDVNPAALIEAPATGTWVCVQTTADGTVIPGFSDGLNGGVRVPLGANVDCTAINRTAALVLLKTVENDNGGTASASDFSLTATPDAFTGLSASAVTGAASQSTANTIIVRPDHVYTLTESTVAGYQFSKLQKLVGAVFVDVVANADPAAYPQQDAEGNWQVAVSQQMTDTYRFVNDDVAPTITLIKEVVNQYGSTAVETAWTLHADSDGEGSLQGVSGISGTVEAGVEYTLTETGGVAGFDLTALSCEGSATTTDNPTVTLAVGQSTTCTFTNVAQPGKLKLNKVVDLTNGGNAVASDWNEKLYAQLGVDGAIQFDAGDTQDVDSGTYTLSEIQDIVGYELTGLSCVGQPTTLANPVVTVANGQTSECTFTNSSISPTITLVKEVVNQYGSDAVASEWTLVAGSVDDGSLEGPTGTTGAVAADVEYTLSEIGGPAGFDLTSLVCTGLNTTAEAPVFTLSVGQSTTCTFTNTALPGQLKLNKVVDLTNGGAAVASDWDQKLQAQLGTDPVLAFDSGETKAVAAGEYALSEIQDIAGYTLASIWCTDQSTSLTDPNVTVANGATAECWFSNSSISPTITLVKEVVNQYGSDADATEWTLSAESVEDGSLSGPTGTSGVVAADVEYTLSEIGGPAGFELTSLSCTGLNTTAATPVLTLNVGQSTTCTFTNSALPGELKLTKAVDLTNGGDAVAADWNQMLQAQLDDGDVLAFDSGETKAVTAGTYSLSELEDIAGYELTALSCADQSTTLEDATVSVANGALTECTFTNSSISPTITLVKVVENQYGSDAVATAWTLSASSVDDLSLSGPTGTTGAVTADVEYTLSEIGGPNGFELTSLVCTGLNTTADAPVFTLSVGQSTTCTFTNTALPGQLKLNKVVELTNGGDAVAADWNQMLQAQLDDSDVLSFDSGETQMVDAGTYSLSELEDIAGYELTDLTCAGQQTTLEDATATVANGTLTECTFTNSSIAPIVTLVKVVESPFGEPASADEWTLGAYAAGGPNVEGTTGVSGPIKAGVEYQLFEDDAVDGYMLTALACTGIEYVDATMPIFAMVPGQTTTCTFTNTEQPAVLTLEKIVDNTNGGEAVGDDWNGLLEATVEAGDPTVFDNGQSIEVAPGVYTLNEADSGPAGYLWTDLTCAPTPDEVDRVVPFDTSMDDRTVSLNAGADVTCTFTNESQKPKLTLEKEIDNEAGGIAAATDWTLSAATQEGTVLSGTGTALSETVAAISGDVDANEFMTLGEMGPSGYTASEWTCESTDSQEEVALDDGELILNIGDDVTCRIVNTAIAATGSAAKQVLSTTQNDDGTWTIEYGIGVFNHSADSRYTYSLTDTLNFGAGVVVNSATWSGVGQTDVAFAVDGTAVLATDRSIDPPMGMDEYTVSVNASVSDAAYDAGANTCDPEGVEASGFLNTALLTDRDGESETAACSEPFAPEIDKSTETVTDNGDGTWDLSYLLTVSAPAAGETETVVYDLTDAPALPVGVDVVGDYTATAAGTTPAPSDATYDGEGVWTIVDGGFVGSTPHVYRVTATVTVVAAAVTAAPACGIDGDGIAIGNTATVISGDYTADDSVCDVVDYDDVSLVKSAELATGLTSVEPGDIFDYVITVTNNGSRAATDVLVEDTDINERLAVRSITVAEGYTWAPVGGYEDNDVALMIDSIGVGESVEIRVSVEFLPAEMPAVGPISPIVEVPVPLEQLDNTACVSAERDGISTNNCDDATVVTRDIAAIVSTRCVGDAPYLAWTIAKSQALKDEEINLTWAPNAAGTHVPASVIRSQAGGELSWSDEVAWPGAAFTPSGVSIDYPGWRALTASDYSADGGYLIPGTDTVMTPEQVLAYVFNGLILDPSELDYAWRLETTVTISVNPELSFAATYPAATPDCYVARHSEVEIEKTTSVKDVTRSSELTYTIDAHNISDDSAAENVVVTDEIPATLKVTDITWPGEGDASVFPNWNACDIAGQDAAGYGGTITCTLFGPLQPAGYLEGASDAPTLTLSATVSKTAPAGDITNIGVVDYNTFGDPSDTGKDADDAVITVSFKGEGGTPPVPAKPALPATGAPIDGSWVILGLLGVAAGVLLLTNRRRRGETRAQL